MMRILYCALEHDYGDPARGSSFEHANFYDTLAHMPVELVHFAIDSEILAHGFREANRRLRAAVASWKPDVLFSVMFEEQIDFDTMRAISSDTGTTTVGWFCDDHWRFDNYSKHWARALEWVVTTDAAAVPRYEAIGAAGVIRSQWACNQYSYRRLCDTTDIDVSFVGQPHGGRRGRLDRLRRKGVPVVTRGRGWPEGRVTQEEMVDIFCRSRVNLNLSASSTRVGFLGKQAPPQIKGRVFEVPGCGGLLMTEWAPGIEEYYVPGEEIVVFRHDRELPGKIRTMLADEDSRARIAEAGYRRTLADHTYERRFADIFERIGVAAQLGSPSEGRVIEMDEIL